MASLHDSAAMRFVPASRSGIGPPLALCGGRSPLYSCLQHGMHFDEIGKWEETRSRPAQMCKRFPRSSRKWARAGVIPAAKLATRSVRASCYLSMKMVASPERTSTDCNTPAFPGVPKTLLSRQPAAQTNRASSECAVNFGFDLRVEATKVASYAADDRSFQWFKA
jgi:hypothetical protein